MQRHTLRPILDRLPIRPPDIRQAQPQPLKLAVGHLDPIRLHPDTLHIPGPPKQARS